MARKTKPNPVADRANSLHQNDASYPPQSAFMVAKSANAPRTRSAATTTIPRPSRRNFTGNRRFLTPVLPLGQESVSQCLGAGCP